MKRIWWWVAAVTVAAGTLTAQQQQPCPAPQQQCEAAPCQAPCQTCQKPCQKARRCAPRRPVFCPQNQRCYWNRYNYYTDPRVGYDEESVAERDNDAHWPSQHGDPLNEYLYR